MISTELAETLTRLRDTYLASAPDDITRVGIRSEESPWPKRWPRNELELSYHYQALPVGTVVWFLHFLHPEGRVLLFDLAHDEIAEETDDPFTMGYALRLGSKRYPELAAFLPPPPDGSTVCSACGGTGFGDPGDSTPPCSDCYGRGWLKEGLAALLDRTVEALRSAGESNEAIAAAVERYRDEGEELIGAENVLRSYFELALRRAGFTPAQREAHHEIYVAVIRERTPVEEDDEA